MKQQFIKISLLAGLGLVCWSSCKKDYSEITLKGGTAPVLTASVTDSIPLPLSDTTSQAVTFYWTNPNYIFSNGPSSVGVTYYLQFDTLGANFTSPKMQTVSFNSSLNQAYTVSQLNTIIGNGLLLTSFVPHQVQVRVMSFLAPYTSSTAPVAAMYSDTLNFTVIPYTPPPAITPPASGTLYITGSATNDSWMVGGSTASVAGQQFTRVSNTLYTITLPLIGGQQFLVVPVAGDWTHKYATSDATGDTFALDASTNFNGPANSGTYTVAFNFQTGTYSITPN